MELCSSYNFSDNKTTTALSCSQALWRIINERPGRPHLLLSPFHGQYSKESGHWIGFESKHTRDHYRIRMRCSCLYKAIVLFSFELCDNTYISVGFFGCSNFNIVCVLILQTMFLIAVFVVVGGYCWLSLFYYANINNRGLRWK